MENALTSLPCSKAEAKLLGSKRFFTRVPCTNGHLVERRTDNGQCVQCDRDRDAVKRLKRGQKPREFTKVVTLNMTVEEKLERTRERSKKSYAKNRDAVIARTRKFIENNPDAIRGYRLKGLYGITIAEYDALVIAQGGVCAICKTSPSEKKNHVGLYVDHNHTTGKVRGLLCRDCNSALGLFQDSQDVLKAAISYLSTY